MLGGFGAGANSTASMAILSSFEASEREENIGYIEAANGIAAALRQLRPECSRGINVHKLTPDGRSWLVHAERFWPMDDAEIREIWEARPCVVGLDPHTQPLGHSRCLRPAS